MRILVLPDLRSAFCSSPREVTIPTVLISNVDGTRLMAAAAAGPVVVELEWALPTATVVHRDCGRADRIASR